MTKRPKRPRAAEFPMPPEEPPPQRNWWDNPPKDVEGMLRILAQRAFKLKEESPEGDMLRAMLDFVEENFQNAQDEIKSQFPIAFFKPSYEQSLLLNAWIWGIDFVVCFSANRIGKTTCFVINTILWILSNDPNWEMFAARTTPNPQDEGQTFLENPDADARFYWDIYDRPVQVLPRPSIESLDQIRFTLKLHPELMGDPGKSHLEPENAEKFARLQELCPAAFASVWPAPPVKEDGTIWLGAPDNEFHKNIMLPEWKKWLPKSAIGWWSDSELSFDVNSESTTNSAYPTTHRIICKSYESEDTKWSGSAVRAIVLTEGLPEVILNEVKQRFKVNGFGSWDYTPYEARNVGNKTALAFKVFKGEEQLPLRSHIFTRFSARKAPAHIIPLAKKDDLIRMWDGKKEGEARLDGIFYSSSPLVLSRLDRAFHTVPWSTTELFERYPEGRIYRGFDPGYDHPSVCCWGLLVPGNIWFIYRYYVERQKTIRERCKDIVRLSGNALKKERWGKKRDEYNLREIHPNPNSEVVVLTAADYHLFKTDENTGVNYSLNYQQAGLSVTESTHMAPEDRALDFDNKLDKSEYHTHPITNRSPGARVFFLINGQGVDKALSKMESLFWDRLAAGPHKGEAKDKVPTHGDDELDATCYLVCGPYVWTSFAPPRYDNWVDQEDLENLKVA